jgi:hypothetical protein
MPTSSAARDYTLVTLLGENTGAGGGIEVRVMLAMR